MKYSLISLPWPSHYLIQPHVPCYFSINYWPNTCMYRPSMHTVCISLPVFSTAPQSFSVNETTARPILLNNITCAGTEIRLTDCPHGGVGIHNCSHAHDVAVSCPGTYCYIMLKTTHSCRMRIERSYIYVHNIFDACMGQHDPVSPTSKLKVTISYWLADVNFTFLLSIHTDLQPYLLFADGDYGTIYRSNLNASGIQQLVRGLPYPFALDFDYR